MSLTVYTIEFYQGNDNATKSIGYELSHGPSRNDLIEQIIKKLPKKKKCSLLWNEHL